MLETDLSVDLQALHTFCWAFIESWLCRNAAVPQDMHLKAALLLVLPTPSGNKGRAHNKRVFHLKTGRPRAGGGAVLQRPLLNYLLKVELLLLHST